jgi:hypothetical protein
MFEKGESRERSNVASATVQPRISISIHGALAGLDQAALED